tara:strand:+ start:33 stop:599 length:567 start_codon:yes stop_codon:yes gene_type:complete
LSSPLSTENIFEDAHSGSFDPEGLKKRTIQQTMEVLPKGTRRLAAQLRTNLKFDSIWEVLTDYNNLSDFIPNLVSSKVISREGSKIRLKQVGSQDFLGFRFSAEVFLELFEDQSNGTLRFYLLKGDFRRFEGSWTVNKFGPGGLSIIYELTVQGCFGTPVSLIEERLRSDLTRNLLAVEQAASKIKII